MLTPLRYLALVVLAAHPLLSTDFYVAPTGSPDGDGSQEQPWDLTTALAHPASLQPGDVIWLRGGTYVGNFVSRLAGAPGKPIIVRQYPGERATLDSNGVPRPVLSLGSADSKATNSHTWYWDFEITGSDPRRTESEVTTFCPESRCHGIYTYSAEDIKVINMTIHGNAFGIGAWAPSRDVEVYGSLIFDNGWEGPDRGHGHGIYTQNQTGTKWIKDNFIFDQFGGGLHVYGSEEAYLDGYRIEGNTIFNNGSLSVLSGFSRNILFGGGRIATSSSIEGNFTYFPSDRRQGDNNIGYRAGTRDVTVTGNYFAGGNLAIIAAENLQLTDNLLYLNVPVVVRNNYPRNTYLQSRPPAPVVFVRRNEFDQDRSHVVVYNWDLREQVEIDRKLTDLSIDECYEIRNVQNYFGPSAAGKVTGDSIPIPLTGWEMREIPGGWTAPSSLPEFGAFIVTRSTCPEAAAAPVIEPIDLK